jgi:hypothetical protein
LSGDFGVEWRFGVELARTSDTREPGARYPRIAARRGESPPQHPDLENEDVDAVVDARETHVA